MVDHASEEEQIEALKRWWRENGRAVIAGAALGILALVGWRGWVWHRDQQALAASAVYDELIQEMRAGKRSTVSEHAHTLRDEFAGTPYAPLGGLAAARAALKADDLEAARPWLRWAMENTDHEPLAYLARARLARVAAALDGPGAGLALLDVRHPAAYDGIYAEIRGDLLAELGRRDAAAEAYRAALDAESAPPDPAAVRRKLNHVQAPAAGPGASETAGEGDEAS